MDRTAPKSSTLDQKLNVTLDDQTKFCEDSLTFPLPHSKVASNIKLDFSQNHFSTVLQPPKRQLIPLQHNRLQFAPKTIPKLTNFILQRH